MTEGKKLTKDDVKKKLNELIDLDYFMDACVMCGLLHFLQKRRGLFKEQLFKEQLACRKEGLRRKRSQDSINLEGCDSLQR